MVSPRWASIQMTSTPPPPLPVRPHPLPVRPHTPVSSSAAAFDALSMGMAVERSQTHGDTTNYRTEARSRTGRHVEER